MRTRFMAAALFAAGLGLVTAPAPAAQAEISGCRQGATSGYTGWQVHSCGSNDPGRDRFRAIAYCIREGGSTRTAYGTWENVFGTSVATCPVNYSVYNGTYGTKRISRSS